MLAINTKAPDFTLKNELKEDVSLHDYLGKRVVLYFYPKDMTSGCTKEACDFRDKYDYFTNNNYVIIGISKDSANSHCKFKDTYNLPFTLLVDKDKQVATLYDVVKEKSMYGKKYMGVTRSTYVIDEDGMIIKTYEEVDYKTHVETMLEELNLCSTEK